jgi:putative ABC transport system ATP-binding protein
LEKTDKETFLHTLFPGNPAAPVATTVPAAVKISRLNFSYPGKIPAAVLDIADWRISRGERVFIKGPSGSGKSTLLNLLAGILTATQGSIEILGQDLGALSARKRDAFRANHIGIVFQQFNLIQYLSVLDNIRLAAHFGKKNSSDIGPKAQQLFTALGLDPALMTKKAGDLSTGQQQRVAIARALINSPEILIADEPTSALDSDTRDAFMKLLTGISRTQGNTLIFVSHDTALAQHFQHVVNLAEINRAGTPAHVC